MSSRTPFSINLDEDYEIYGIDPNEDLNDWSFLEAKPEPLPERDEEEKRLFEQLLAPSIPEEEIQTEIHDRLKSLLDETSKFIENDVKVELSAPIEISEDQINQFTDKDSFEHKQADRMSTIVKDILHTTQEAEDIDDLIKTLTKSDKIAEEINEEIKKEKENTNEDIINAKSQKQNSFSNTSPATLLSNSNPEEENQTKDELSEPKNIQDTEAAPPQPKLFLERYKRKPGAVSTIIRDQDQTERLSSKFLLDKRKREEENQAELERRIKEREERQKSFFESLDKEVEKHKREVQMIKEIKESKAPSLSEMINQIRPPSQEEPSKEINPALLKPKSKKAEKPPPRYTKEKIDEFLALRTDKLQPKSKQPVLVIELATNNSNKINTPKSEKNSKTKKKEDKENTPHLSNTYQKKVGEKLAAILAPLIKEKKKTDVSKLWKIAIFMRMAVHLRHKRLIEKVIQYRMKLLLKKWRKRRKLMFRKRTLAAISIQRAFRRYKSKLKEKQKADRERKEITDQQILDKTRQMISQKVPDPNNKENLPSQKYQQQKPKAKPNFSFPILNDPDTSWIDTFEKEKIEGDESSGLFFENEMLDELPNKPIIRLDEVPADKSKDNIRHKHRKGQHQQFQAESQSVPFENNVYDYLSKFGQKIDLKDQDIEGQEIDIYERANAGSRQVLKKNNNNNPENDAKSPKNAETRNSIQSNISANEQQPPQPQSPQQNDTSLRDGYNFKNQNTAKMMQKMLNKKTKQSNPYKNEKPVEKFNRLYGASNGAAANHHAPNIKHTPQERFNNLRTSNTRAQRLKNLKKVWLGTHHEGQQDQPPSSPDPSQGGNQE